MQTLPPDIHLGMNVYDSRKKHIGKIDDLKFPENAGNPDVEPADIDGSDKRNRRESVLGAIADAFGAQEVPLVLRDRLLTEGYIRIDTDGLLAKDRFILPSQIASATADAVTLNVEKDALIKQP
ncbi:MAG: hypothetical protein ABI398_01025 [Devosia sp.]